MLLSCTLTKTPTWLSNIEHATAHAQAVKQGTHQVPLQVRPREPQPQSLLEQLLGQLQGQLLEQLPGPQVRQLGRQLTTLQGQEQQPKNPPHALSEHCRCNTFWNWGAHSLHNDLKGQARRNLADVSWCS
jgi:hypothetical protein